MMRALGAFVLLAMLVQAHAREGEHWESSDATIREWYRGLMRPDFPAQSCCGESDAYWADSFEQDGDSYVAVITDDRPDAPLGRPHIPSGTRVRVPNAKLKYDHGNPTGHGVIFISPYQGVLCYVAPGGV